MPLVAALALLLGCSTPRPKATAVPPPPAAKVDVSGEVRSLYEAGVTAYAKGDMKEAAANFEAVLKLEPGHVPAQRGLRRIRLEGVRP